MGLSRWFGGGNKSSSGGSSSPGVGIGEGLFQGGVSINDQQHDWAAYVKGDFSGFQRTTPEAVEAAKKTAQELKEQKELWMEKNAADTASLESIKQASNNEQFHTRQRLDKVLSARDHTVRTGEHLAEKIQPGLHEQNERLGLSQAKGQEKIADITARFAQRRNDIQQLRSNWG